MRKDYGVKRGILQVIIIIVIAIALTSLLVMYLAHFYFQKQKEIQKTIRKINKINNYYFYTDQATLVGIYGNREINPKNLEFSQKGTYFILSNYDYVLLRKLSLDEIHENLGFYPLNLEYLTLIEGVESSILLPSTISGDINYKIKDNIYYLKINTPQVIKINYTSPELENNYIYSLFFPPLQSFNEKIIEILTNTDVNFISINLQLKMFPAYLFMYAKNYSSYNLLVSPYHEIKCSRDENKCYLIDLEKNKIIEEKSIQLFDVIAVLFLPQKVVIVSKNETISLDTKPQQISVRIYFISKNGFVAYPTLLFSPVVEYSCLHEPHIGEFCYPTFLSLSDIKSKFPSFNPNKVDYITSYYYSGIRVNIPLGFLTSNNLEIRENSYIINDREYPKLKYKNLDIITSDYYLEKILET